MSDSSTQYATTVVQNGVLVLTAIQSEVRDAGDAYAWRDEMIKLINPATVRDVVIDLGRVQFLGSVGLVALLGVRRHLDGGRIVLCNLQPAVNDILSISRLIPRSDTASAPFEAAESLDEAIRALTV